MSKFKLPYAAALFVLLAACTHSPMKRTPALETLSFDTERVQLLRLAAENSLLFQIPDATIRDLPVQFVGDNCRQTGEGPWAQYLYSTLRIIQKNPALAQKIHLIEFQRGDSPRADLSKDLDGAVHLVLSYSKVETRHRINSLSDIPCASGDMTLIGKDKTVATFEWPSVQAITKVLTQASPRPPVERFEIDKSFALWLADRMSILRLTPELSFEKTHLGDPLLPLFFAQISHELHSAHPAVDFWMHEISRRSKLGQSVIFFGLKKEADGLIGIEVESKGKFARKLNGLIDPSYPYLSYRLENQGGFTITPLQDLENCMDKLMASYKSPMSFMGTFETDAESFLFPGHHCPQKQ